MFTYVKYRNLPVHHDGWRIKELFTHVECVSMMLYNREVIFDIVEFYQSVLFELLERNFENLALR